MMRFCKALAWGLLSGVSAASALDLDATLGWSARTELGTLVSGVVLEVPVKVGEQVKHEQLLVKLDDREFKARLQEAEAVYRRSREDLAEARREDERARELYERTVLSDHERQQFVIKLVQSEATMQRAAAVLTQAKLDLERSSLAAPYDGVVVSVAVAPGQVIVSELQSRPLVIVADNREMLATAAVDADKAARLQQGAGISVAVRGQWFDGQIAGIGVEPSSTTDKGPRYALQVLFKPAQDLYLRAGEKAVLRLPESK